MREHNISREFSPLQLSFLNAVAYVVTVISNALSATGVFSSFTVGDVSALYPTPITPAGPAFGIWSVIYTLQGGFVLYCLFGDFAFPGNDRVLILKSIGVWFALACLCNSLWIIIFVQATVTSLWLSVGLIICLLFCLCMVYFRAQCWIKQRTGGMVHRFLKTLVVDIHLSMYAGWVTVASTVSITAALGSSGLPVAESSTWGVGMLCVAFAASAYVVISRYDCVWGVVLTWASLWIAVGNQEDAVILISSITVGSLIGIISSLVAVLRIADSHLEGEAQTTTYI